MEHETQPISTPLKIVLVIALIAAVGGAGYLGAQTAAAQRVAVAAQPPVLSVKPAQPLPPAQAPAPFARPVQPLPPAASKPLGPGFRAPLPPGARGFSWRLWQGDAYGAMMGGWPGQYSSQMHAALAKALGMSEEDFDKALLSGKDPWQIAQEKNIGLEDFQSRIVDAVSQALKQAVADGSLTQAEADSMLARMKQNIALMGQGRGMVPGRNGFPQRNRGRR